MADKIKLDTPIDTIRFTPRIYHIIARYNLRTVGDLVNMTEVELLRSPNFGRTSLLTLRDELANLGLSLRGARAIPPYGADSLLGGGTASKEFHPLIELMLARMESHPEEFEAHHATLHLSRWDTILREMQEHTTEEEKVAIAAKLRIIRMDTLHREAMDELLNGEERRRKYAEDEAQYASTMQTATASGTLQTYNQLQNAYSNQSALGLVGSIKKGLGI